MLASYRGVPPGVVPTSMLSDQDLWGLGYEPATIRRMEQEMAEMGLGLGLKLPGFVKAIGKGIGKAAKGVAKAGKFVATKAVPTIVKTGIKAAPILVPAAAAIKFGPGIIRTAGRLIPKIIGGGRQPEAAPVPEPAPAMEPVGPVYTTMPAPILKAELPATREPTVPWWEKVRDVAQKVAPLLPEAVERLAPEPAPTYAPTPAGPTTVTVAAPPAGPMQAGMGFDPKMLLFALPLLFFAMKGK